MSSANIHFCQYDKYSIDWISSQADLGIFLFLLPKGSLQQNSLLSYHLKRCRVNPSSNMIRRGYNELRAFSFVNLIVMYTNS